MFREIYSCYYTTLAKILSKAVMHPITNQELLKIVEENAFSESMLSILPALSEEKWQLLKDGRTPVKNKPTMPLTKLQKAWLNAVLRDPRFSLFREEFPSFEGIEPLFLPEDVCVFDCCADGDPYQSDEYKQNFRTILRSLREHKLLRITAKDKNGNTYCKTALPKFLEYSGKDDKFRLITGDEGSGPTWNLARILSCEILEEGSKREANLKTCSRGKGEKVCLVTEIIDERNSLERALLHFAHFEKEAERISKNRYRMLLWYDREDETEVLIRVLSFGPFLLVTEPESFVNQIKERLARQKAYP